LSDSKNEVFQLLRIMQRQLLQQCTCRTRFGVYRFCKCGFATGVQVSWEFNSSNEIHDYHHIVGAWVVFTYKGRWFACNYCFLLPRPQALSIVWDHHMARLRISCHVCRTARSDKPESCTERSPAK